MTFARRTILVYALGCQVIGALGVYVCSASGLHALRQADRVTYLLKRDITALSDETDALQRELSERISQPYYQESIARKELQMAYPDETVYLLPEG